MSHTYCRIIVISFIWPYMDVFDLVWLYGNMTLMYVSQLTALATTGLPRQRFRLD